ncbi:hypothetical protein D3C72_1078440 [compost metagenome]
MRGQEGGAVVGQARIGLLQTRRHGGLALVGAQFRLCAQFVQPARQPARRLVWPGAGQAEALQIHHAPHPLRAHPCIDADHVGTHAVAHQIHLSFGLVMVEQRLEVGHVVREPVRRGARIARRQVGLAKPAPVHGNHVPVALQRIDKELERRGHVHPAVQHEQLGRAGRAPMANVRAQAAQRDKFGTRGFRDGHGVSTLLSLVLPGLLGHGAEGGHAAAWIKIERSFAWPIIAIRPA